MKRRFLQMVFLGIKRFRDPYYQGFAAQISFYLLLSIVPVLLILTQILGYFNMSVEDVVQWLSAYTGNEISSALHRLIEFSPAGAGKHRFPGCSPLGRVQSAVRHYADYQLYLYRWADNGKRILERAVSRGAHDDRDAFYNRVCPGDSGLRRSFAAGGRAFAESGRG